MLARVFATEPEMFPLDEPTADLDPAASLDVQRSRRETAGAGVAVVIVSRAVEPVSGDARGIVLVDRDRLMADLPTVAAQMGTGQRSRLPLLS